MDGDAREAADTSSDQGEPDRVGEKNAVHVFDTETGKVVHRFDEHTGLVFAVAVTSAGVSDANTQASADGMTTDMSTLNSLAPSNRAAAI